jgi:hypothetical protein
LIIHRDVSVFKIVNSRKGCVDVTQHILQLMREPNNSSINLEEPAKMATDDGK